MATPPSAPAEVAAVCPHFLSLDYPAIRTFLGNSKSSLTASRLPCGDCGGQQNLPATEVWLCLSCPGSLQFRCGRNQSSQHSLKHFSSRPLHSISLNPGTGALWCYKCDREIPDIIMKEEKEKEENSDGGISSSPPREIFVPPVFPPLSLSEAEDFLPRYRENPFLPQDIREFLQAGDGNASDEEVADDGARRPSLSTSDSEHEFSPDWSIYSKNSSGGLSGLANLGNTCYFNAGVQALLHCPALVTFFLPLASKLKADTAKQRLIVDFSLLAQKLWSGRYSTCSPADLHRDLVTLNSFFRGYGQHDTQEFLRCLLDNLHEGEKSTVAYNYRNLNGKLKTSGGNNEEKKAPPPTKAEISFISDLFQGSLLSQVRCHTCGSVSSVLDPFYDLSLEMPADKQFKRIEKERGSDALAAQQAMKPGWFGSLGNFLGLSQAPLALETCLHSFCTADRLLHGNQYHCEKCKAKVDATKHLTIGRLPEVFTVHVKRFSHNSYFSSKINRTIVFPLKLDLAAYMDFNHKDTEANPISTVYSLFAIVRHIGSTGGGHYVSYAKHSFSGKWFEFDDRRVTEVSEERILKVEAYILFYQREYSAEVKQSTKEMLEKLEYSGSGEKFFISRRWWRRVETLERPEPVDNRDLCCEHGILKYSEEELKRVALPVSRESWEILNRTWGSGGPLVTLEPPKCLPCEAPKIRAAERQFIGTKDVEAQKISKADDPYYIIHDQWLKSWRAYIAGNGERPGKITNDQLVESDGITPRAGLEKLKDYRGLHGLVWSALQGIYGGGPELPRLKLDIYEMTKTKDSAETREEEKRSEPSGDSGRSSRSRGASENEENSNKIVKVKVSRSEKERKT